MLSAGRKPNIHLLRSVYHSLSDKTESDLIRSYRNLGGRLTNSTGGGDGSSGLLPEIREKISRALKGRPRSDATKRKIGISMAGNKNFLGKKHSKETKGKISIAMIGNRTRLRQKHSEETRAKMRSAKLFRRVA
jgi:hypothetical protein